MKFDLKSPCATCPFRPERPFPLTPGRVSEITSTILGRGSFACHKTTTEKGVGPNDRGAQYCAGALLFQYKLGTPGQMAIIAERLGIFKPDELKFSVPVYDSVEAMERGCSDRRSYLEPTSPS